MSTVFEMIIEGAIPGRFVWSDDKCVVFSTIEPVTPGHMLVVPRDPIDKWTDLPPSLLSHLFEVAQIVGKAQQRAFGVPRSGMVVAGFEVPHSHIHVIPASSESDIQLANARPASGSDLDDAANALRDTLRFEGYVANVPMELGSPTLP